MVLQVFALDFMLLSYRNVQAYYEKRTSGNLVQHGVPSIVDTYLIHDSIRCFLPGGKGRGEGWEWVKQNDQYRSWSLNYCSYTAVHLIQVVLADGRIAICTEDKTIFSYPNGTEKTENQGDLFWAFRGGGGGTFGVVSYYVLKIHQTTAMVKVSFICPFYIDTIDLLLAEEIMNMFSGWIKTLPSYWGGYFVFDNYKGHINASQQTNFTNLNFTGRFFMLLNKFGPWDDNTESELQILYELNATYGDYVNTFIVENKTSFWDYTKDINDNPIGRNFYYASLVPEENYNEKLTQFFLDEFLYQNDDLPLRCVTTLLGGEF